MSRNVLIEAYPETVRGVGIERCIIEGLKGRRRRDFLSLQHFVERLEKWSGGGVQQAQIRLYLTDVVFPEYIEKILATRSLVASWT